MSNKNLEELYEKYINFLGAPDFPEVLSTYFLDMFTESLLLSAHMLTIGFQTTNIKEGSICLEYWKTYLGNNTFSNYQAKPIYSLRLKTNGLIEGSNNYSRSSIKTENPHYKYRNTYELNKFIIDYPKEIFKSVPKDLEQHIPTDREFNLKFSFDNIKTQKKKNEVFFKQVIESRPIIISFIRHHYLQQLSQSEQPQVKRLKI